MTALTARRVRDSNPGRGISPHDFQSCALDHSANSASVCVRNATLVLYISPAYMSSAFFYVLKWKVMVRCRELFRLFALYCHAVKGSLIFISAHSHFENDFSSGRAASYQRYQGNPVPINIFWPYQQYQYIRSYSRSSHMPSLLQHSGT